MVEVTEKIHGSNARFSFRTGTCMQAHVRSGKQRMPTASGASVLKAQPWIEEWCKANPGYGLYGEVTPTQGEKFQYGSAEPQLFVFDIRTPEGKWISRDEDFTLTEDWELLNWVPELYFGPFDWVVISKLVDGQTAVPKGKGIREGLVIRPLKERHVRGLGRLILKVVSNAYLEKDGK